MLLGRLSTAWGSATQQAPYSSARRGAARLGTARDGTKINMVATATDIARRGPDGLWRYLIDNPFGSMQRSAG